MFVSSEVIFKNVYNVELNNIGLGLVGEVKSFKNVHKNSFSCSAYYLRVELTDTIS